MNRSTKSLISGLAVALVASLAPAAFADAPGSLNAIVGAEESSASDPSSLNAIVGGEPSSPSGSSSLNAIVGGDEVQSARPDQIAFSTPNSIVGADRLGSPSPGVATASATDGFDWGDAAIGTAVGLALALMLGAVATMRRRDEPRAQPSV